MKCLVTGAAGFIGSHLCEKLLDSGFFVTGIDSFTDYYSKELKKKNLEFLVKNKSFELIQGDINMMDMTSPIKKCDFVFHLAAQAGVRASWGDDFSIYTKNNIESTQKILETCKKYPVKKIVYASSSSVYGNTPDLPMKENSQLIPYSPYGVTKLAAENLCSLYHANYGLPVVSLRYFTVYGPRQRPDMAFHKFLKAVGENKPIEIYGTGEQTRDFTYIDDIVTANISAAEQGKKGEIYNLGGGNQQKLSHIFPVLETVCQKEIQINKIEKQKGDVQHTYASISKAQKDLCYQPLIKIKEGLEREWLWIKNVYSFQ
ncbi:MAG: NAD-dependent epimerase/dehydratase family protein [Candidatus Aminicenantes bacterium]|nr:NAD-dependent epimerase/dehydratase family protein [Candidatus Aminicenantes bacterium]